MPILSFALPMYHMYVHGVAIQAYAQTGTRGSTVSPLVISSDSKSVSLDIAADQHVSAGALPALECVRCVQR